jgi:hypothetical protein
MRKMKYHLSVNKLKNKNQYLFYKDDTFTTIMNHDEDFLQDLIA